LLVQLVRVGQLACAQRRVVGVLQEGVGEVFEGAFDAFAQAFAHAPALLLAMAVISAFAV
jgi:hypothetical protein